MSSKINKETHFLAIKVLKEKHASAALLLALSSNQMTPTQRNEIIDIIGSELCENGFNKDHEPNSYGQKLEKLIDFLNRPNIA